MTDHRLLSHTLLEFGDFTAADSPMREKVEMQLFFADWCGHCRRFKPMWRKLAKHDHVAVWTEVDCTDDSSAAQQHNVRSFPTIHRVSGDTRREFKGERTHRSVLEFAQKG